MAPHLTVMSPLPDALELFAGDLNPRVTGLEHTTALPGGYETIRVNMRDLDRPPWGRLPADLDVRGWSHVTLEDGQFLCGEGRLLKPQYDGVSLSGFEATGYGICGLADGWYPNQSTSPVSALTILKDVLGAAAPLLMLSADPQQVVDSGIAYTPATFYKKRPAEIVDTLGKHGGGSSATDSNTPYDWLVYEGRMARFGPRIAPLRAEDLPAGTFGPTYLIDFESQWVTREPDFSDVCTDVTVFYSGTSVTRTDARLTEKYGIIRSVPIEADSPDITAQQATQIAATYLALHARPKIAYTIRRTGGRGLRRVSGTETPPQCVRAGEWIQVGDDEPAIILKTSFNWNTEALECQCAWYPPGYWGNLAEMDLLMRAFQFGLNPNSGLPA